MEIGILLLRAMLGMLLLGHSAQKLFGWFHGPGPLGARRLFSALGIEPSRIMVPFASVSEALAAILLIIGFCFPLGVAIAAAAMFVAGYALASQSGAFWNSAGGGEYPLVLAVLAIGLGFTGPGAYSLDDAISAVWHSTQGETSTWIGSCIIVLVAASSITTIVISRSVRRHRSP
ncbi:DoxX family protein [Brevibacterium oceani]|uniref:DoxX family protein n=1 Tax=Brevibacterium oceani TaxID=358099 RepID=UPI001B33D832|nr:DoxX family protein [Brevibacterium oceani]